MIVRTATIEELDILNEFYYEMNKVINTRTNHYDPNNPVFPAPEFVQESIEGQEQFVGVEEGNIACACIANHKGVSEYDIAKWHKKLAKNEYWVLHALRVSTEYEGRGFAKQMLNYIFQRAKEKQLKAIRLDVFEGYSVEKMYESLGFQYVDTIEIFYEDIGKPQRFRLLEKLL